MALALVGCKAKDTQTTNGSNYYEAILPYETSDTRTKHIGLITNADVRIEVESGLMDLSKQHFSPDNNKYKSHVFLDFDELDATDGSRGLLGTLRDDNPNGLNPDSGTEFDTGNGTVTGAVVLVDLYELDFYSNDQLKGISIALVVNNELEQDGKTYPISDEVMKNYLEVTCSKLVGYLRERFNDINSRVPIYIAAYGLGEDDAKDNGGYFYSAYFNGNHVSYENIDQDWVLVPSTNFTNLDPTLADQFNTFKEDVSSILVDNTYVTGKAMFLDGKCRKLNLDITTHGKTVSEILAAIQGCKTSLSVFENDSCSYSLRIYNNETVYAVMQKNANSSKIDVIELL